MNNKHPSVVLSRLGSATRIALGHLGSRRHPTALVQSGTLSDHDLLVVVSGTMGYRFGPGKAGPWSLLRSGQGILLWPGDFCATQMKGPVHLAWFHFHFTQPGRGALVLAPPHGHRPKVGEAVVALARGVLDGVPGSRQILEAGLWKALEREHGSGGFPRDPVLASMTSPRLVTGVDHLLENLPPREWNAGALARALDLHPNTFGTRFRRETGVPIRTYLWKKRLDLVGPLLSEGASLADVAQAAGYGDGFSFSHAHKRFEGRSPRGPG